LEQVSGTCIFNQHIQGILVKVVHRPHFEKHYVKEPLKEKNTMREGKQLIWLLIDVYL
jgi:hypothetical protein